MNFIIWLVVGGIIGWLASLVMKTDAQQGIGLNIVVGIVGALLGGWLGRAAGWYRPGEGAGYLMSIVGAIIVLFIYRLIVGRSRYTT
jgi:uncharacterized membrane protein YeaQ/YmgE (transglycosylase-associated protein family)